MNLLPLADAAFTAADRIEAAAGWAETLLPGAAALAFLFAARPAWRRHTARRRRQRVAEHPLVRRYQDGPDDETTLAQLDAELDRRITQINLHDREEGRR